MTETLDDAIDNALNGDESTDEETGTTKKAPLPKEKEGKEGEVSEEDSEDEADEDSDGTDSDSTEEDEDDLADDDDEDVTPPPAKQPSVITSLKKEFPNFAKKYPQVIDAYFQVQEFKQLFGSVDDAKMSVEKADVMDGMLTSLDSGEIEPVLDILYQRDPESLEAVVTNFLPVISKKSPKLFKAVISPVVRNVLANVGSKAQKSGNEQLVLAVRYLNNALFGEKDVPDPVEFEPTKRDRREESEEVSRVERIFFDNVESILDPIIDKEINIGLDPDNAYPEALRETAANKIKKMVFLTLKANPTHMRTMAALRKSAVANDYSKEYQRKIARTVANAAKEIIPSIRAKVKKQLLGGLLKGKVNNGNTDTPNVPASNGNQALVTGAGVKKGVKFEATEDIRSRMDKVLPT